MGGSGQIHTASGITLPTIFLMTDYKLHGLRDGKCKNITTDMQVSNLRGSCTRVLL